VEIYVRSEIMAYIVNLSTVLEPVCVVVSLTGMRLAVLCVYKLPEPDKVKYLRMESELLSNRIFQRPLKLVYSS